MALIHYRCTNPAHVSAPSGTRLDTLTIHDGKWAWCPHDVHAEPHEWTPTGGVELETLLREQRTSRERDRPRERE